MDSVEALALPCMPRAVALLMSELLSDTPNLRRVNQLFASDPVLALRLLELANAPALRMSGLIGACPRPLPCWARASCARCCARPGCRAAA